MSDLILRAAIPADAAAIAQVRVDSWRATYRGILPDADLDSMKLDESAALWERILEAKSAAASVFVAERDGAVLGFAAGKLLEEEKFGLNAELAAIYMRPDAQRAGIGRRLVGKIAEAHQAHGAHGLIAWVLAKNEIARQFFEDLGAELLIEQPFTWNEELELVEAGYGWRDLNALLAVCGK
ncbi:MAG TPA: GNAT family N-acetyltransferase [Paucimonas sp.]|nr:GNAT family N-acetyltransferase [Paucimonas sp.]